MMGWLARSVAQAGRFRTPKPGLLTALLAAGGFGGALMPGAHTAQAAGEQHAGHGAGHASAHASAHGGGHGHGATAPDPRIVVEFPAPMRDHTLANMRDHLAALAEIQHAMARQSWDQAAELAERRLGMSALQRHGAHAVAPYMPEGMRAAGSAMHRSASRFALAARNAAVLGDSSQALSALAELTGACVACHAGYRFK
jgi:hypothetical protein